MIRGLVLDYYGVLAEQTRGGWRLDTRLIGLLQNMRRDYKIGLISNSYAKSLEELNPQLDAGLFDAVLLAGATGLWKPETIVYETAAARLDLKPAELLVIDDNQRHLEAAAQVGCQTHLYKDAAELARSLKHQQ